MATPVSDKGSSLSSYFQAQAITDDKKEICEGREGKKQEEEGIRSYEGQKNICIYI